MEHVSDDLLERYALNRTSDAETAYVEEHLILCEVCRQRFVAAEVYATSLQGALRAFVTELIASHEGDERPVNLFVRSAGDRWIGRISGPRVDGGMSFQSRAEAAEYCVRAFREMFPEHQCGAGCFVVKPPSPS